MSLWTKLDTGGITPSTKKCVSIETGLVDRINLKAVLLDPITKPPLIQNLSSPIDITLKCWKLLLTGPPSQLGTT